MPRQRTLLDGDTGAKFDSLELRVGEAANGLAPGAYDGEPLVWNPDAGEWVARSTIVVDQVQATNVEGASLLLLNGHDEVDAEDNISFGYLDGSTTHFFQTIVGGATVMRWERIRGASAPRFRAFDNGTTVARPSVNGVTTQQQLDSLIAALVALGWITDAR